MAKESQEPLPEALHQMHATASRSETLTTFDDFAPPPELPATSESKGIDLVQSGFSGLYSRLKASVGVASEQSAESSESASTASRKTLNKPVSLSPGGTAISSPVVVSAPSSQLQSPATATFPDNVPPSRDSSISNATLSSKLSLNASKSSAATSRSRPLNSSSVEAPQPHREDSPSIQSPLSASSRLVVSGRNDVPPASAGRDFAPVPPPENAAHTSARRHDAYPSRNREFSLDSRESNGEEDDVVVIGNSKLLADRLGHSSSPEATRDIMSKVSSHGNGSLQFARQGNGQAGIQPFSGPAISGSSRAIVSAAPPLRSPELQRPQMLHLGPSHLPGYRPSRASSSDGLSSVLTNTTVRSPDVRPIEAVQRSTQAGTSTVPKPALTYMGRKILDKEFWMRDENAKDCFNCGDTFTTFRRKHHCRTCGQIFDSKCTSVVSGKIFGQAGNLKVCKPCEAIIHGHDDDSSEFTEDGEQASLHEHSSSDKGHSDEESEALESDHTKIGTPTISIPMSRKSGSDKKRRSHVIEVGAQTLARPSSSRSLRSLSGRPHSSSHKRHPSRHQHMRNIRHDERAPFHQTLENPRIQPNLSAFHHDNIIDPELAPFMSDEESSENEQASLFTTLRTESNADTAMEAERGGFGGLLAAMRKSKQRSGDRNKDADNASTTSRQGLRSTRNRNPSISSANHRPSPRHSKSKSLLRPFIPGLSTNTSPSQPGAPHPQTSPSPTPSTSRTSRRTSMQADTVPPMSLNTASLDHTNRLLKQMLYDAGVRHVSSWQRALMPILRQCTLDVNPDIARGDDIDIRNYIKLKKIPGGKPRDIAYVSGVVFTKNVALRSMPRNVQNPRIAIINFAIEYARHQAHFMSLEPVIAQEKEYLHNLVHRIAALRPQVLLVQRNVSGLALELLEQEGIAVAYNVQLSVLNAVSRCTRSRMISSVDKLAIDPAQLGHCGSFDVKTFVYKNAKKTYIFLSGCPEQLGCTIVLRGAEDEELVKVKRITEFMVYVVHNLRLENSLLRDEFINAPVTCSEGTLASWSVEDEKENEKHNVQEKDQNSLKIEKFGQSDAQTEEAAPSYYSEMVERHRTKILSSSPFVKFTQPYVLEKAREYESRLGQLKKLKNQYISSDDDELEDTKQKFELVQPEMVHTVVNRASKQVREFLSAVHASEYYRALHQYNVQKRLWETYVSGNIDLYDPFNHQKIAVLYSVVRMATSTPCVGPEIIALGFYQENDYDDGFTPDCTLGQYVEDLCNSASDVCEVDGCGRKMMEHSRQYVHGEGQISVIVQRHTPKLKGMHQSILMWSCCRVCGHETQVVPMSAWTWKYSFAKYLELAFWSTRLRPRAIQCLHDIHRDHVRYLSYNHVALRIQYDPVTMYEVIVPKTTVTWNVDSDLKLKNEQYTRIEQRLDCFMQSVRGRIQEIHVDGVIPEKMEPCRKEIELLLKRVDEEHEWLRQKLQDKYMNSKYYEIIPMNRAIRAIQEKAIAWDDTFNDFEQQFFPSEKDIRRLATLQLKKFFLERDESTSSLASVEESIESGTDEPEDEKAGLASSSPSTLGLSQEKTRDMLTSVVKDNQVNPSEEVKPNAIGDNQQPLTPQNSTPHEAVEREDVRHLDLAVPASIVENPIHDDHLKTPTLRPHDDKLDPGSPTPTNLSSVNPIDQSLAQALDNLPPSPSPRPSATTPPESRIPRLIDSSTRESATRPAALARTQSQPGSSSKHAASSLGSSISNVGLDLSKPFLSDSAKALERMTERLAMGSFKHPKPTSRIPRSIPLKPTKVSKLAEHFEQLSREFQKERMRERRNDRNRQIRAYPLASSKPVVEVYKDVHEAVQEHDASDEDAPPESLPRASTDDSTLGDSIFTETTDPTTASQSPVEVRLIDKHQHEAHLDLDTSQTPTHPISDAENDTSDADIPPEEVPLPDSIASSQLLGMSDSQFESSLELPKHEKTTMLKMLTSFWSERSASGWKPLDYPFAPIEHVWEDSDIIVREDEPSSVIALALSCPDYLAKLYDFRNEEPMTDDDDIGPGGSEGLSVERNLLHERNTNIRYSFTNRGVQAQIKIFFAESFDALRQKCGVADRIVESLSRCTKWDSKGGKSKSIFLKTLDERFILKSLSPVEVQAFFRFAPNYFLFTHQTLFKQMPSVIAKMFGLFQVQIKTPTGRDFDRFMLVMENLFYDREPNRRYDLKGSMRNRKIESTGERDEVLLDENLVDLIYSETPIFVREHTKKLLKASVWNDTLFLSQNNVMDYSLMAGFDDTRREIIVGIIDCIRTYTWDKKLESWIKDRGKNKPTITSPKDYRNRFRIAMEKYILQAPNCWHQFSGRLIGQGVERRRVVLEGVGADKGVGHSRGASTSSVGPSDVRALGRKTVIEAEGDEGVKR